MNKNDKDLSSIVIDFSKSHDDQNRLDEGWMLMFGGLLKWIMPSLFKGSLLPLKIKGSDAQVESFADVLSREKSYLESWKDNGLDNPMTYQNKGKLDRSVSKFERVTGLRWPFST